MAITFSMSIFIPYYLSNKTKASNLKATLLKSKQNARFYIPLVQRYYANQYENAFSRRDF